MTDNDPPRWTTYCGIRTTPEMGKRRFITAKVRCSHCRNIWIAIFPDWENRSVTAIKCPYCNEMTPIWVVRS